ncbi:SH2 domain-containing protein 2A isoform X2 [Myxocyprinus asiaticus]|uniref:SH2 domain-containing protein 2A isoform X2 n=1 Tax=Myxocyprinus asiaticus TaxID=70543 RepID=UPI0022238750|nr:SH2 domain-containing protein 2A isoform X2 [Myxocyprinus asiaticus]
MDFDYKKIKDAESRQRDERLKCLPVHQPRTMPHPSLAPEQPAIKKPPVKPRRSIKGRPTPQQETEQLNNQGQQKENEMTVKRMAPSLVLGPVGPLEPLTPSLRAHTLLWFERTQLPRLQTPGHPLPCWLHGFATRREAEQLLQDKPQGCFLLRLSESKIGFVLSYRGEDRCRHFIIEEESGASGSVYLIAGENSHHRSLEDLINYYTYNPVGPYNEMLTMPCVQHNGGYEEIEVKDREAELGVKDREAEGNGKEINQDAQTRLPMATGQAVLDPLPSNSSNQITSAREECVQYAAVRKPLKKTYSLPECKCGPDTAPPSLENGNSELVERPINLSLTGDQAPTIDVPYARVNKPPRAVSENIPNVNDHSDLQRATASSTPPTFPSFDMTAADQKYWKLEPMHTYEETPHTCSRTEEIDCYAVVWKRQAAGDADQPKHHLYSEVNIRGAQDGHSVSPRPRHILPLRPPPRPALGPLRPESAGQSSGVSPLMVQPQHSGFQHSEHAPLQISSSSIYEQIPARPTSSRPNQHPPNPKR